MSMQTMDFAGTDDRSVSAGLRGVDDGRVRCHARASGRLFDASENMSREDWDYRVDDFMDAELPGQIARKAYLRQQFKESFSMAVKGVRDTFILQLGIQLAFGLVDIFCAGN